MRLNQVTVSVADIERAIAFYELLGLRLIVKSDHYARFEAPRGESTFSIHLADGEIPRANAPHIYFEVHDVDFEYRRLKHAGVAFEHEPKAQTWLWYEAWLRDPDGNALCLFNAGDNRRYPPWRIDTPPPVRNLHLVIREGEEWAIVKLEEPGDASAALQALYDDFKTSLGPYDLFDLLAMMESEWPDIFLAHEHDIRDFVVGDEVSLEF
ncbi:MAG: VOC family protein [Hyphomonadaceae bacterium]